MRCTRFTIQITLSASFRWPSGKTVYSAPIPKLVGNHIDAKRYNIYKDPSYYDRMSEGSKGTFAYQEIIFNSARAFANTVDFQGLEESESVGRKNFENTIKGGIMTPEEAKVFENDPLFADSLLIRKYDELAKIENMKINVSH